MGRDSVPEEGWKPRRARPVGGAPKEEREVIRSAVERISWLGKSAVFVAGLAAMLAAAFVVGGAVLGNGVPGGCPAGFRDAAAKTYAANDATSTPRSDINFGIVFI